MVQNEFVRRYVRPLIPFPKRKTLLRYFPPFSTKNIGFIFSQNAIDTVIDIGANRGQFASGLRSVGYKGRIVSFEPNRTIHAELKKAAAGDPNWIISDPVALGQKDEVGSLIIPEDSSLASFLPSLHATPKRSQSIEIRRLDDLLGPLGVPETSSIAIKIDVQGFELNVLQGAPKALEKSRALLIEVCLNPTYVDEVDYLEVLGFLKEKGFRAVDFFPVIQRRSLGESYQMDVLLVRR